MRMRHRRLLRVLLPLSALLLLFVAAPGGLLGLAASGKLPSADARGHQLGPGPPLTAYPWPAETSRTADDPWGFTKRQCTSYAAWFLNSHGVPFAARTRGPAGTGVFRDAHDWDLGAVRAGFVVSRHPAAGTIAQWHALEASPPSPPSHVVEPYLPYRDDLGLTAGPFGHVAVVTAVLPDTSVLVAGYDGVDREFELLHTRAPRYLYIGVPFPGPLPATRTTAPVVGAGTAPTSLCG